MHHTLEKLPEPILARLIRLEEAGADLSDPRLARALPAVLTHARYLTAFMTRHPREVAALADLAGLETPVDSGALRAWLAELEAEGRSVAQALRIAKYRAFLKITARDLILDCPIAVTCAELSAVAEVTLERALQAARASVEAERGPALGADGQPIPLVVFGMGKLGGWELNYSSDVDLIYVYETDDGRDQRGTAHEHFRSVCERLTRLMDEVTDEGFVFRVDLRLRPEGQGGPVCNALLGMERYYEAWGRTWERIAWQRARPVAGDRALGQRVLRCLSPWIHPRTIDPAWFEAVSDLKGQILHKRAAQGAGSLDLKLDVGGIRAVEFFANVLQLAHSGRNPTLRHPSTLVALNRLFAAGLIGESDRDTLADAYALFRRVEHRVQMQEERQTHLYPKGEAADRLALSLGYGGDKPGETLKALIDGHRQRVGPMFDALLAHRAPAPLEDEATARLMLSPFASADEKRARLQALGLRDPAQALHLLETAGRAPQSPLSVRATAAMARLGESLVAQALMTHHPERTLAHLAAFIAAVSKRTVYLDSLSASPALARLLINVLATSDFLSDCLVRSPWLVDVLFDPAREPPRDLEAAVEAALLGLTGPERIEALAAYKRREWVRIGLSDLAGQLDGPGVEAALSALAEVVLRQVLAQAQAELTARHGQPRDALGHPVAVSVVAFGKLGGRELSYGSDLDVVFLYQADGQADGPTGLSNLEYFTRLAQRVLSLLSLPTRSGALYALDTRLRPDGRQGTLVSRLARFEAYHTEEARPWERLALVRARAVAGPPEFMGQVERALAHLTYERPVPAGLRAEMRHLRGRMEREVARETEARMNPKSGRGGIVDIEFLTQILQLENAAAFPELKTPETVRALERLGHLHLLADWASLLEGWRFLRRLEHRLRIARAAASPELRTEPVELAGLARRLGYQPAQAEHLASRLLSDYRRTTERVRGIFESFLGVEAPPAR